MSHRRSIVAANWKMNRERAPARELALEVERGLAGFDDADVVLCPPFTALETVGEAIAAGPLQLGAQNLHWEHAGAFTGEISTAMLRDVGCDYVIIGHSERRTLFGETDREVNLKTRAALDAGLRPIVCVGETLEQREAERTEGVVREQVERSLAGLEERLDRVVIAYEPVWAIGTGRTATPQQAQEVHALIRDLVRTQAGEPTAVGLRIQYGGSVKPDNAAELFRQPDIDGGLIGGASLDAASFETIVRAVSP
jgi:triosephosphate isomerase